MVLPTANPNAQGQMKVMAALPLVLPTTNLTAQGQIKVMADLPLVLTSICQGHHLPLASLELCSDQNEGEWLAIWLAINPNQETEVKTDLPMFWPEPVRWQ